MEFIEALRRPFTRGREFFLFVLCSLLPVVNFFAWGYGLRAAVAGMRGKPLERWNDPGRYFKLGFFYLVVGIVYAIPVIILILLGIAMGITAGALKGGLAVLILLVLFVPLLIAIGLLVAFLSSAAIMALADTGRLGAAFDLRRVMHRAFTGVFFLGWVKSVLVGMMYAIVILPVTFLLTIAENLTGNWGFFVVRILLSLIVSYPVTISSMTVLGDAYRQTRR